MSAILTQIPIIDFASFRQKEPDQASKEQVAEQVHRACKEVGFFYLKNSGLSAVLLEKLFVESQQFFALPAAEKNRVAWSDEYNNRGYVAVERENLDPTAPGDLKEAYNVGKEVEDPALANKWPINREAFRETVLEFYGACTQAASMVLEAFAISLQLPEDFFQVRHSQQEHTLRLLHYPPIIRQAPKSGQVRAGEHSDYGSITLLFQDAVGGLEVQTAQGEWIDARPIKDTILVNTGDLMERWTNGEFRSTRHRVKLPARQEQAARDRYSVAFFCSPNPDTEIACIETCQTPERPALYPPISAGEYLLRLLRATY